ncbi:MAG: hypothetical protein AABW53_00360 [Nanoarchaeota archaeon]
MSFPAIFGVLLLIVVIFLVIRAIINSIRLFFFILLVLFFLVFFFDISISEVSAWLSSQERLQWLTNMFINSLLFSFSG